MLRILKNWSEKYFSDEEAVYLLVVLLAPILGVIADRSGRRKGLLLMLATAGGNPPAEGTSS